MQNNLTYDEKLLLYLTHTVYLSVGALRFIYDVGADSFLKTFGSETERNLKALSKESFERLQAISKAPIKDKDIETVYQKYQESGVKLIFSGHPDYPPRLKELNDAPPILFLLGNKELLSGDGITDGIAVIGTRAPTKYGTLMADRFARELAGKGHTVISGLAMGIDTFAHKGALARDGKTIAFLGAGINIVYPRSNYSLFQEIRDNGLLVSEYPLGTEVERFRFPERNRLMAALSRATLVIECGVQSGTLSTVSRAKQLGRPIYAVPHEVINEHGKGGNLLIAKGDARLVLSAGDLLEDLGYSGKIPQKKRVFAFNSTEAQILSVLSKGKTSLYNICVELEFTPAEVMPVLKKLETQGVIAAFDGGLYALLG